MTAPPRPFALPTRYQRLWRQLRWHRRKLGALCAAVAVFASLNALRPPAPPTVPVLTAARDLAAGATLHAADLTVVNLPRDLAPAQSLGAREWIGRSLAARVARGTPLTRLSLTGDAWSGLAQGRVAVAVRLQDPAVAGLLSPGQHVGLVAVDPRSPTDATSLASDAVVLAVPPAPQAATASMPGRLVVVAVPTDQAAIVISTAVSRYLGVTWGH